MIWKVKREGGGIFLNKDYWMNEDVLIFVRRVCSLNYFFNNKDGFWVDLVIFFV